MTWKELKQRIDEHILKMNLSEDIEIYGIEILLPEEEENIKSYIDDRSVDGVGRLNIFN